jgi:hypothetical protein
MRHSAWHTIVVFGLRASTPIRDRWIVGVAVPGQTRSRSAVRRQSARARCAGGHVRGFGVVERKR